MAPRHDDQLDEVRGNYSYSNLIKLVIMPRCHILPALLMLPMVATFGMMTNLMRFAGTIHTRLS